MLNTDVPLAVGGRNGASIPFGAFSTSAVQPYSLAAGAWTSANWLGTARYLHSIAVLSSGEFMAAGGLLRVGGGMLVTTVLGNAEQYNPITGTWTETAGMLAARADFTLTPFYMQEVLAVGCGLAGEPSAEFYTP